MGLNCKLPRVVFFRNKETGTTGQYVLHYIPDPEYLDRFGQDISKNQLDKIDKNFTGYIRYSDWEGKPLKSLRIKKGRVLYALKYGRVLSPEEVQNRKAARLAKKSSGIVTKGEFVCEPDVEERVCEDVPFEGDPENCDGCLPGVGVAVSCTTYIYPGACTYIPYENDPQFSEPDNPCLDPANFDMCWPTDPDPEQPQPDPHCIELNKNNVKAKSLNSNSTIKAQNNSMVTNILTNTGEKAFVFGKDVNGVYKTSTIISSSSGSVNIPATHSNFTVEGSYHNHTSDGTEAPSPKDVYGMIILIMQIIITNLVLLMARMVLYIRCLLLTLLRQAVF